MSCVIVNKYQLPEILNDKPTRNIFNLGKKMDRAIMNGGGMIVDKIESKIVQLNGYNITQHLRDMFLNQTPFLLNYNELHLCR